LYSAFSASSFFRASIISLADSCATSSTGITSGSAGAASPRQRHICRGTECLVPLVELVLELNHFHTCARFLQLALQPLIGRFQFRYLLHLRLQVDQLLPERLDLLRESYYAPGPDGDEVILLACAEVCCSGTAYEPLAEAGCALIMRQQIIITTTGAGGGEGE
jgi:hypothetical protein